ncbi:hypothetical protein O4G98_15175 [Zoogloeaceae bacterium G21618-S1]|nr:hypothetical protein [Zoogloeaceae bacterium G21618-S1]
MNTKNVVSSIVVTLALTAGLAGHASAEGEYGIAHYNAPKAMQAHAKADGMMQKAKVDGVFNTYINGR